MEYIVTTALSVLCLAGGIFSAQRHIQMYQQNSYFMSRYIRWAKSSPKTRLYLSAVLFLVSVIFLCLKWYYPLLGLTVLECAVRIYTAVRDRRHSIKKLVYTNRVKRLFAPMVILPAALYALFIVLYAVTGSLVFLAVLAVVFLFLLHFPASLAVTSAFIMHGVEKSIARGFVKEAEEILRSSAGLKVIGVTGSYGKTSVKFMLKRMLSEKYNVVATPESFNTPMGIVRTVREQIRPETEVFIAEMGAKNPGDIKELCEIANPSVGIITAVGPQHLESFKSLENVQKTKFELADWCKNVYVNFDSKPAREKAMEYVTHSYGTGDDCETRAVNINIGPSGTSFDIVHLGGSFSVSTRLLGRHNILNITGAAAVALELGVLPEQIKYAVSSLAPTEHRLEKKAFLNGSLLIDDSYNSNPEGSMEALEVLSHFTDKKKVLVTPGMVELGDKEYEYNYNFGRAAAERCDIMILVGENRSLPMKKAAEDTGFAKDSLFIAKSFKDAMELLKGMCDSGTVVLFENDLPDNYAG